MYLFNYIRYRIQPHVVVLVHDLHDPQQLKDEVFFAILADGVDEVRQVEVDDHVLDEGDVPLLPLHALHHLLEHFHDLEQRVELLHLSIVLDALIVEDLLGRVYLTNNNNILYYNL